jgi:glycerophosphoryl diester phosphodiesterase
MAQQYDIEGHRGCRGLMPENTLSAFLRALDLGVTTLELDVCVSKDRQMVVSHEPYFHAGFSSHPDGRPVLKGEEKQLNLFLMDYADIRRYDVGLRGNKSFPQQEKKAETKPLLKDILEACEAHVKQKGLPVVSYNIEIKSEASEYGLSQPATVAEFSDLVAEIMAPRVPAERLILQSFDFAVLKHWHQQRAAGRYPKVKLSVLVELKGPERTFEELGFLPDIFSPYFKLLGEKKIHFCHQKGVKVVPWTVNEVEDMKRMKAIGTDGLISDYPDRALALGHDFWNK